MKEQEMLNLFEQKQSVEFYENRYEKGYMDEWPAEKKRKILEVIKELQLPVKGEALDFGCGNGVLTEIIRQALPSWKIYGTDISLKAITNASTRYPGCRFFEANDPEFKQKQFDFIFSNHVFEHVFNLNEVFNQMNEYLKKRSSMLHFLPCGNEGSFEYNICLLIENGINKEFGNRFFFEDEGHIRRLTTNEFSKLCETKNFMLKKEYYFNQYFGSVDWITCSDFKAVLMFFDTSKAVNNEARQKLKKIRMCLVLITVLRLPARIVELYLKKSNKKLKHYMLLLLGLTFYLFSYPVDRFIKRKAGEEWNTRKHDRNGSEMCLYFQRLSPRG